MKAFMEDYGLSILSAIIIAVLIVMASPIGQRMIYRTKEIILSTTYENIEKEQDSNNSKATINIEMDAAGNATIKVPVRVGGVYLVEYSVKHEGLWSDWNAVERFETKQADTKTFVKNSSDVKRFGCGKGDFIKFRVVSDQIETHSNILKCER